VDQSPDRRTDLREGDPEFVSAKVRLHVGVGSVNRQQEQSRTLPLPISAPGSALGLLPSIALSSAQAMSSLREAWPKRQTGAKCGQA
jgi:hypothetical protein